MESSHKNRGFTLVELLVVIAIIGILIALLMPAVQSAREAARRTHCSNNLKQLCLGILSYESTQGTFPAGEIHGGNWLKPNYAGWGGKDHCDWDGYIGIWMNLIFPQIEQQGAYDKLEFDVWPQYSSPANREIMQKKFPGFMCPSDPYDGLTTPWGPAGDDNRARMVHYYAVNGSKEGSTLPHDDGTTSYGHCNAHNGIFFNDSKTRLADVRDGTSNTAMVCEVWGRRYRNHRAPPEATVGETSRGMNLHMSVYFDWTPNSNRTNPWKANSFHPGGVHVGFADGNVHFIADTVHRETFQAVATIAGEEVYALEQVH